jgi:hypothetical protein
MKFTIFSEANMTRTLLIANLILVAFSPICASYAAPPATAMEEYELQERCGKRAAELYNKKFGSNGVINTKTGQSTVDYTNHYNKKLKKCFVLQTYRNIPYRDRSQQNSITYRLYDINENRTYGDYFKSDGMSIPTTCKLGDEAVCHSEEEWNARVKPLMEE